MEWIGDAERAFAAFLYPNRVAIGIAAVLLLAVLGVVAARRGWFASARRRPGRALALLTAAVVVAAPAAWYLASPLFLSTTVDEPAPVAVVPSPPASPSPVPSTSRAPRPSPTPTPAPPLLTRSGTFRGADEFHFGRGTATLIETAPGSFVVRLEDFEVRNGPDLYVYLSPSADGYAEGAIELARLKADRGNQNYEVPADIDVAGARSVVIWCRAFSVQFAVAALS